MKNAEEVMNDFMQKLNNDEFAKDICPQIEDNFYPDEETIGEKLNSYRETLYNLNGIM